MPAAVAKVTRAQALAFRMRRQLLDPIADATVEDVVRRLCGVQAQVASSADLAIRVRRRRSSPGDVARGLSAGRLVKTWAMRGTLHLLTPDDAGAYLSVLAAGRSWELPSWQRYFGLEPRHWARLRPVVRDALGDRALTREELVAAIVREPGLDHVADALRSGWGTLLKPLAWQGDLCHGPNRGTRVTFMRPEVASPVWAGLPAPEEAAPRVVSAYLGGYGPATPENLRNWLARGRIGSRRLRSWFTDGVGLARVLVDGEEAWVRAEDVDDLAATRPTRAVRLVPGFDQYVLGAGTGDRHVVPAGRRAAVSRQSGWIAPVVVAGGVVAGTWVLDGGQVGIDWFREAGPPPGRAIAAEVERLGRILDRTLRPDLRATVEPAR